MVSFFRNMLSTKKLIFEQKDKEAAKAYARLQKYVEEGSYSSYKKTKKLVGFILNGYKNSHISGVLGISEETVRVHIRNVSNELYSIFGDDFFELFQDYQSNKVVIDKRIYIACHSGDNCSDFITTEVIGLINGKFNESEWIDSINIKDCSKELAFLVQSSIPMLKKDFEELDVAKLNYLMRVLDGSAGTVDDRYNFMCLMNGMNKL